MPVLTFGPRKNGMISMHLRARQILLCFCLFPVSIQAQGMFETSRDMRPQRFALGGNIGLTTYSGDIDKGGSFNGDTKWLLNSAFVAQVKLAKIGSVCYVNLLASGGYDPLKAASADYDFADHVFHVGGLLKLEFFTRSPFRPYVAGGFGMVFFRPRVSIKSAETEAMYPAFEGSGNSTTMVPLSVGVLWTLGHSMDFFYEFTKMLAFTDNLDGWVAEYNDNYQSINFGILIYF